MDLLPSDPAFYKKRNKDKSVIGFSGGYVNDMLRAGTPVFRRLSMATSQKFKMGKDEELPCSFSGFRIDKNDDGTINQNQKSYLKQLEVLPLDAPFSAFRSMRMKIAWLA